jgi:hypothetical protein
METWMILLLIALVAVIIYFATKRTTLAAPVDTLAVPIARAPGVSTATGEVYSNPPPPPPPSVTATVMRVANPGTVLQHIPVAGSAVTSVSKLATNAPMRLAAGINNSLSHIPVVGSALAAPLNAANKVASKLNPFNW